MLRDIDVVVWDFDGVINRNYDDKGFLWSRTIEADLGVTRAAIAKALFTGRWAPVLTSELPVLDLLAQMLPQMGFAGTPQAFFDYWMARDFALDRDIVALMRRIRALGKVQAIGTNNEPLRTALIWNTHGLRDLADHMFSSGLMRVAKPSPNYFEHVQHTLGVTPERILFIEDTPKNVEAARVAGWRALSYGDSSKLLLGNAQELAALLGL